MGIEAAGRTYRFYPRDKIMVNGKQVREVWVDGEKCYPEGVPLVPGDDVYGKCMVIGGSVEKNYESSIGRGRTSVSFKARYEVVARCTLRTIEFVQVKHAKSTVIINFHHSDPSYEPMEDSFFFDGEEMSVYNLRIGNFQRPIEGRYEASFSVDWTPKNWTPENPSPRLRPQHMEVTESGDVTYYSSVQGFMGCRFAGNGGFGLRIRSNKSELGWDATFIASYGVDDPFNSDINKDSGCRIQYAYLLGDDDVKDYQIDF